MKSLGPYRFYIGTGEEDDFFEAGSLAVGPVLDEDGDADEDEAFGMFSGGSITLSIAVEWTESGRRFFEYALLVWAAMAYAEHFTS